MIDQYLESRRALVTASSRNLGAAIVTALAGHGATVCVQYHQAEDAARHLVQTLTATTGRQHAAVPGDMSDATSVRTVIRQAESLLGGIDILVNNAGPFSMTSYATLPESEWDAIWNTNVKASFLAAQSVAEGMRRRGWGRIVNISAGSAYLRNHSIYALAKSGLMFLTEELALELGPEITVNAVSPGQIAESAEDIAPYDPTFVERAIEHTPAGRLVTRAEVAELVALLCGPAFAMVTGATVPVDGGWRFNRF
jgi:NAD(P)-dependent dehydrogenase (short-subunit alcohol dehydrogenase family)